MLVAWKTGTRSDSGQYGVALRWYAEDLNSTEFGFYFMNYHSRLPFASQRLILGSGAANSEVRSYLASEDNNSGTGRGTNAAGCFAPGTLEPCIGCDSCRSARCHHGGP